jgi:hypothetical protein
MVAPPVSEPRAAPGGSRLSGLVADDSRLAIGLHYVSLAAVFVLLVALCRHLWFFGDDYKVLVLMDGRGAAGFFEPFAEHWLTIPKAIAQLELATVGFRTYWPTILLLVAVQVASGHLLWRLLRQMGIAAWIATGLTAAYLVGVGTTITLGTLQIGWIGAIALGLGAIVLVNHGGEERGRDVAGAGLATLSIAIHSGVVIAMLVPATLVALFRRGVRGALVQAVPPLVTYGVWFLLTGRNQREPVGQPGESLAGVPRFAARELVDGLSDIVRLDPPLVALALLALGAWLVWHWRQASTDAAPAYAMAVGAVVVYVAVALGRGEAKYRYAYLAWLLVLPAFALALQHLVRSVAWRCVVGVVVSVAIGLVGIREFRQLAENARPFQQGFRSELVAIAARTRTDPYVPEAIIRDDYAPLVRVRNVVEWRDRDRFETLRPPSPEQWRVLAPLVQVRYVRKPPPTFRGGVRPTVGAVTGGIAEPSGPSCLTVRPEDARAALELIVPERATVSVEGPDTVEVQLPHASTARRVARSSHPVPRSRPEYVELAADTDPVLVVHGSRPAEVCGVRLDPAE